MKSLTVDYTAYLVMKYVKDGGEVRTMFKDLARRCLVPVDRIKCIYSLHDPITGLPFYVGSGSSTRFVAWIRGYQQTCMTQEMKDKLESLKKAGLCPCFQLNALYVSSSSKINFDCIEKFFIYYYWHELVIDILNKHIWRPIRDPRIVSMYCDGCSEHPLMKYKTR